MSDPAIALDGVCLTMRPRKALGRTGGQVVLSDVSWRLERGKTLGIVGRNGAGKSTLLRVVAGIVKPDKGTVSRFGLRASLLALNAGVLPHLSGRDNAIMSGMLMGLSRRTIEGRLTQIKEFSELGESFDQPVSTYSTGMRARLGFSTALQVDPDIILIDETLGVGDAEFRLKSRQALREKILSEKTVVLVSHERAAIQELCDAVLWIEQGRVQDMGPVEEVMPAYLKALTPKSVKAQK
jgi:lipopolysaccharide transport system ATP-binding protein